MPDMDVLPPELRNAFNWSCKRTLEEFQDFERVMRGRGKRLDAHTEASVAIAFAFSAQMLGNLNRQKSQSPETLFSELWEAKRKTFTRGSSDRLYDALINGQTSSSDLITYLAQYQAAAIGVYLGRKIPFAQTMQFRA